MRRQAFGTRKDDTTSDLDLMFCTDSLVVSNIMRLASEPRAYTTIRTFTGGNNAETTRIKAEGCEFSMILKQSKKDTADSLVYEYLAGLSINELACYYPCFPRTYLLTTEAGPTQALEYEQRPSRAALLRLVSHGCEANGGSRLRLQYMPVCDSIDGFVKRIVDTKGEEQVGLLHSLVCILHTLYFALSSVAGLFTHYDLHTLNVGVVEIAEGAVHVTAHSGDSTITYTTRHMPVMWDFGRSFVDCRSIRPSLHSSDEIFAAVCDQDKNDYSEIVRNEHDELYFKQKGGGPCADACGDKRGYSSWPFPRVDAHYRERVFERQEGGRMPESYVPCNTADNMLISRVLGDKRLCASVKSAAGVHPIYAAMDVLMSAKRASVHETLRQLSSAVSSEDFQRYISTVAVPIYKELHVWYGLRRPFSTESNHAADEPASTVRVEQAAKRRDVGAIFTDASEHLTERDRLVHLEMVRARRYTALSRDTGDFRAIEGALRAVCDRKAGEVKAEHESQEAVPLVHSASGTSRPISRALELTYGTVTPSGYVERRMCVAARYDDEVSAQAYSCGSRNGVVDTVDLHLDERGRVLEDLCAVCDTLGLALNATVSCATKGDYDAKKEKYARLGFETTRAVIRQRHWKQHKTLVVAFKRAPRSAFGLYV